MMKKILICPVLGIAMLLCANDAVIDLPLNEGDVAAVRDAAGNQLEIKNPQFLHWADGADGKVLEFKNADGNTARGSVNVRMPAGFDLTKGFSFTATIKTGKDFAKRRIYPLFRFADAMARGKGVFIFCNWNMVWVRMGAIDGKHVDLQSRTSDVSIQPDSWYRLAVTYDGKTAKIYLNGRLVASQDVMVENPVIHRYLLIGSTGDGAGYGFDGIISQVRIYDRALNENEITALQSGE